MDKIDVAVVGAGPAGLTSGIYLGRARLKTVIFEKAIAGGQMAISEWIENYPGFSEGISGQDLSMKMREQAVKCGAEIIEDEITGLKNPDNIFILKASGGKEYQAMAVVIAAGAVPRKMNVPGEEEFVGRGVSYCATCDAPLFKEKTVVVVGGGDTAVQEAIFLAKYAKKVYLAHRRDRLRATKILAERLLANKKIEPIWSSVLTGINGDKKVTSAVVSGRKIECDGVFIFAGIVPSSRIVKELVDVDEAGHIITDENMNTSRKGIFACGDVRKKSLWQVVTACGDAAVAAVSAQYYVENLKGTAY
ncbi:MAG: thioredoxin-disulfide reductase [Candidatus Omnitrophica bacterium CG12_big_fil_rev_8_21_14_0_65_43_15]|uniref:Thioredoxin reductase n=1 Tax=Candidatus Taenaricola geysiri TaxID=1974752 RepID=A0A2J0LGQ8_9BACT|nr:MAG: thioredoxin-disulfide reductase [Candidatus Omnitrophica bacterium CG03_land_8_20_14_0_80_43_22]PIW67011.1 MAG: thioredoxin-disulfide reductase [Candidatus Omnitrophica bacterium CG12_big_fil_rev_8_21_14_0_65_43_15]PIW80604.1 MAG: thioredoxin-disulfide reductase [Candidatus Omnitrophica bacterium CG_4_8_14_3_um_filter_43_15]